MKNFIFLLLILFCNIASYSQSVGISEFGTAPNQSALPAAAGKNNSKGEVSFLNIE